MAKKKIAKRPAVKRHAPRRKAAKKVLRKTQPKKTASRVRPPAKKRQPAKAPKKVKKAVSRKATRKLPKKAGKKPIAKPKPGGSAKARESVAKGKPSKALPAGRRQKKSYIPDVSRPTGMYGGVMLADNPKPFPRKSPYSQKELSVLKQALVGERDRLRHELAQMENFSFGQRPDANEAPGHSVHIAEHASDMQSTETNIAVRTLDEERLAQVEEALYKLQNRRQYGLCIACGEKIGIERLIAKPHAHLCMDCRRKYERERQR